MSDKNKNDHRISYINVCGAKLEVISLENSSQVDLVKLGYVLKERLPVTFWIDLIFEIESILAVRVISLELMPSDLGELQESKTLLHIIHEPKSQVHKDICRSTPENQYVTSPGHDFGL